MSSLSLLLRNNGETARHIVENLREFSSHAPGYPGAVSCLEWQVAYDTRAKYFITAADVAIWTLCLLLRLSCYFGGIVRNMLGKVIAVSFVVATILLVVLLQMTAPTAIGPLGILIVFILMYLSILGAFTFLLFGASRILSRFASSFALKRPLKSLTLSRSYYFSSVIALAPVMFIGMQSVGKVGVYDILLVIIFVVIACVYISKRTR